MAKKQKYYVVWKGRKRGIFDNWEACKAQVEGFVGAEYKGFDSFIEAAEAFSQKASAHVGVKKPANPALVRKVGGPKPGSYAVDAACSGNPGKLEYRGVDMATGVEFFYKGPFQEGTNNIGEFLAIVHGLNFLQQKGITAPVYSDSDIAIGWVKAGACRTKLAQTGRNQELFTLIRQAEAWLEENPDHNPVLQWRTDAWGENPADFGRK